MVGVSFHTAAMSHRRQGHRRPPASLPDECAYYEHSPVACRRGPGIQAARMKSSMWIYAAAGYNVALAAFHLGFWRMFRWREELPKLHPANRGVMQVLNLMLTVFLLLMGGLQILRTEEIVTTPLGRTLMAGLMGCWLIRAALQPVFFKSLPSATNVVFVVLFLAGAGLHAMALPVE